MHNVESCDINVSDHEITETVDTGLNLVITENEVTMDLSKVKNGKATGYDNIPTEVLKNKTVIKYLLSLFNKCFHSGRVPTAWQKSIINPIPKSNVITPQDPAFYRGISLTSIMYKLYVVLCSVLNERLYEWANVNNIIPDKQNGFKKKRSCIDHVSTLTSIIDTRRKLRKSTYTAFIDFSKAFDRVNKNILWSKLGGLGINDNCKMLNALKSLYVDVQSCVRVNGYYSEWFDVSNGLKQGCILSPLLFSLYISDLVTSLNTMNIGVPVGDETVRVLLYADDIVLLADSVDNLQSLLDEVHLWCQSNGLCIESKTQIVHFRVGPATPRACYIFKCGDKLLETVDKYRYLGIVMNDFLDFNVTAKIVAQSASRALGALIYKVEINGGMPAITYEKLYNCFVQPVIDYGSAIWDFKDYSCINEVFNRACRFYLGIGKYTTNAAVQGDMGWCLPNINQWSCICRIWCRLVNMSTNRLCKRVFLWARDLANNNRNTWSFYILNMFRSLGCQQYGNVDTYLVTSQVVSNVKSKLSVKIMRNGLTL